MKSELIQAIYFSAS